AALALAVGDALAKQVADIDADVVQVEEANIPGTPDGGDGAGAAMHRVVGGAPPAINRGLDGAKRAKEKAVHVCFGNYGGQSIQKGEWRKLIGFINRLHFDPVVLEFAFPGVTRVV